MAKARPVRGATLNSDSTRFNLPQREADRDWLDDRIAVDGAPIPLRTSVTVEQPKTIIARNTSPDIGFDRSVNPYRGCDQPRNGCVAPSASPTPRLAILLYDGETRLPPIILPTIIAIPGQENCQI